MKARINTISSFILLFFAAQISLLSPAYAQTSEPLNFYNVEIIVFKLRGNDYFNSETWKTDSKKPDTSKALDLNADASSQRTLISSLEENKRKNANLFKKLDSTNKTLAMTADALNKSKQYELLSYKSWLQPGLSEADAIAVRIKGGRNFKNTQTDPVTLSNTSLGSPQNDLVAELDGSITIILSRFLHIRTDLALTQAAKWVAIPSSNASRIQLNDTLQAEPQYQLVLSNDTQAEDTVLFRFIHKTSRRMRSSDLHHLDHPMFGVLVRVSKADK